MKKPMKIFLGIVGVAALFGICFACLSVYAKKEINKPKFELPEAVDVQPMSQLPSTKEAAFDYVNSLYGACFAADDIELSCHTDVHFPEEGRITPFSDADNAVFGRVLEQAQGGVSGMYPKEENTLMTALTEVPSLGFAKEDVTDFTAVKGITDENGKTVDDGYYYITLTVQPTGIDTQAMLESDIRKNAEKTLEPLGTVSSLSIVPNGMTATFKIRYDTDMLTWVELKRNVTLKASVDFAEEYKALSAETAALEIPYEAVQSMDLFHYGLDFTEKQMAVQKGDMKTLPLDVRVDASATKENYTLTFTVSDEGILEIDGDGVMSVVGTQEAPVTVTAVLEYDGHTYQDQMTVYATELEVKTDEPQNS